MNFLLHGAGFLYKKYALLRIFRQEMDVRPLAHGVPLLSRKLWGFELASVCQRSSRLHNKVIRCGKYAGFFLSCSTSSF